MTLVLNSSQLIRPWKAAMTKDRNAPKAPASVGVTSPE